MGTNICAENKILLPIVAEKDELKLLSSLNTIGYVEFCTLYDLSSFEKKFVCVKVLWLSRDTYHYIGNYIIIKDNAWFIKSIL